MKRIEFILSNSAGITPEFKDAIIEAITIADTIRLEGSMGGPFMHDIEKLNQTIVPPEQSRRWPGDLFLVYLTPEARVGATKFLGRQRISKVDDEDAAFGVYAIYRQIRQEK